LVQLETEGKSEYLKRNIEKFLQVINRKADLDNFSMKVDITAV